MTALAQTDPNVRIPKGAKRAAALADELHKQAYAKPEGEPDAKEAEAKPAEDAPAAEAAPTEEPKAETASTGTDGAESVTQQSKPEPKPTEDWEHKYNSMKGRYDRAEEFIRGANARIAELQAEIDELKKTKDRSPVAPAESLITEKEIQDYGAEFLDVVGKKAREIAGTEVAQLQATISDLTKRVQDLGGTITKSSQDKMFDDLDRTCPKWKEINVDQNFIAWLQLPDTYSGVIRHNLLKAAFERNDSPRVLAFFNGFLAEEAAVAPANFAAEPTLAAPAPSKVPLENLAAPGRAKSPAATSAPAEKPIITRAQIAGFYTDVANGKYRGKDEERTRLERSIFEAQQDGRIR